MQEQIHLFPFKRKFMKQHILFIDDDKNELLFFLDALKQVPQEDGFKCTYASSSIQAIEMLKYLVPDFIFVDNKISEMNGLHIIRQIKNDERLRSTKVFMYSSSISEYTFWNAMQAGANGCIKKCDSIEKLTDELRSIFLSTSVSTYILPTIYSQLISSGS